jgi:hypothetical protein
MWLAVAGALGIAACGARTPVDELYTQAQVASEAGAPSPDADSSDAMVSVAISGDGPADVLEEPEAGCKGGCDDGVACTRDRCDTDPLADGAPRGCVHEPDDSLCPPGLTCSAQGCTTIVYACERGRVWEVTLPAGSLRIVGSTGDVGLTDIALDPAGTLYGLSDAYPTQLLTIDRATANVTTLGALELYNANALVAAPAPSGTLYLGAYDHVHSLDATSLTVKEIAYFPGSYNSAGDLAFVGERLFASARLGSNPPTDTLMEVNLSDGSMRIISDLGFRCVWGLSGSGPLLFGFTCEGNILSIDPTTGASTKITRVGAAFTGAASHGKR